MGAIRKKVETPLSNRTQTLTQSERFNGVVLIGVNANIACNFQ